MSEALNIGDLKTIMDEFEPLPRLEILVHEGSLAEFRQWFDGVMAAAIRPIELALPITVPPTPIYTDKYLRPGTAFLMEFERRGPFDERLKRVTQIWGDRSAAKEAR